MRRYAGVLAGCLAALACGSVPASARAAVPCGPHGPHGAHVLRGSTATVLVLLRSVGAPNSATARALYYACLRPSQSPVLVGNAAADYTEGAIVIRIAIVGDDVVTWWQSNDGPATSCVATPVQCNAFAATYSIHIINLRTLHRCVAASLPVSVIRTALQLGRWSCRRGPLLGPRLPVSTFRVPGVDSFYQTVGINSDLATAADGSVWVTQPALNAIARFDPYTGETTEYRSGLSPQGSPWGIVRGPDGALWFTDFASNSIMPATAVGRIDPATGAIVEYQTEDGYVPPTGKPAAPEGNGFDASEPTAIAPGGDGNLWVAEVQATSIGRVTPAGNLTQFGYAVNPGGPLSFTALGDVAEGPDGDLWFTTDGYGVVARFDPTTEQMTLFSTGPSGSDDVLQSLAAGPEDTMWFTVASTPQAPGVIVRVDAATGQATRYPLPPLAGSPDAIVQGPDNAMWFTFDDSWGIGRLDPATGAITIYYRGVPQWSHPDALTVGLEGTLWFADDGYGIGRIDVPTAAGG